MKPKLLVIAGPNGSGKTSVTSKILEHAWMDGCTYINPDQIAKDNFGDWNNPQAVLQAAQYAENLRLECLAQQKSLCFETVFSAPDKLDFLQKARQAGYFIRFFFVGTEDPTINAARIARRVMEGGHDVPIPKIISRYSKSISNSCAALALVDRAYIYDNTQDFADPKLLFRTVDGVLQKTYEHIPNWAQPIFKTART